jgi:hypothetical protein
MKPVVAAMLAAGLALPLLPATRTSSLDARGALHRTGMALAQSDAPKEDAPGADAERAPREDPQAPGAAPPPDSEGDSNIASPPSATEPPGCIFNKGPLELIV